MDDTQGSHYDVEACETMEITIFQAGNYLDTSTSQQKLTQ